MAECYVADCVFFESHANDVFANDRQALGGFPHVVKVPANSGSEVGAGREPSEVELSSRRAFADDATRWTSFVPLNNGPDSRYVRRAGTDIDETIGYVHDSSLECGDSARQDDLNLGVVSEGTEIGSDVGDITSVEASSLNQIDYGSVSATSSAG